MNLLPCPFCGSTEVSLSTASNMVNEVCSKFAECHVCAAMGPECMPSNLSDDEATKLWNNRASNITSELADGTAPEQSPAVSGGICSMCHGGGRIAKTGLNSASTILCPVCRGTCKQP
jgi:Lar family restriction alleviation protein